MMLWEIFIAIAPVAFNKLRPRVGFAFLGTASSRNLSALHALATECQSTMEPFAFVNRLTSKMVWGNA